MVVRRRPCPRSWVSCSSITHRARRLPRHGRVPLLVELGASLDVLLVVWCCAYCGATLVQVRGARPRSTPGTGTTDARLRTPAHPAATGCVAAATRGGAGSVACTASLGFVWSRASCSPSSSYIDRHCRVRRSPTRRRAEAPSWWIVIGAIGPWPCARACATSSVRSPRSLERASRDALLGSSRLHHGHALASSPATWVFMWVGRRGDHDHHHVPRRVPAHEGSPRGVVEVRHHLLGRIALAFLGTVLVYLAALHAGASSRIAAVDVAQ